MVPELLVVVGKKVVASYRLLPLTAPCPARSASDFEFPSLSQKGFSITAQLQQQPLVPLHGSSFSS